MRPVQWIFCVLGRHHRDGRQVVHDGVDFRGPCVGCGKPMIRMTSGTWIVARGEDSPPPT